MSLEEGNEIFQRLKTKLSSWMLPRYVVDLSHRGGKQDVNQIIGLQQYVQ
jgi:L-lysine 2,3-aminomutase